MIQTYRDTTEKNVINNAGGLVHEVSDMDKLERFLILGTVGGTYYVNEKVHTLKNLKNIEDIIDRLGQSAIDKIIEIGVSNRAPNHEPTLVAFSIACSSQHSARALPHLNKIVRTGTHLFHFVEYVNSRRGWGRALKRAVANWYIEKSDKDLAYQVMKYKQRDGWSHRDILRLSHPSAVNPTKNAIFKYVTSGTLEADDSDAHEFMTAAIMSTESESIEDTINLIRQYQLPREVINTELLKEPKIWEAMLPSMGMTAVMRNLRNMHKYGFLVQGSDAVYDVVNLVTNEEKLKRSRVHPAQIFLAMYNAKDIPMPVQNALEEAFYMSFANVVPTNKRICLALDVSGSMGWSSSRSGPTAREWSAVMAMVTARSERFAEFKAFTHALIPIDIRPTDSIETVIDKISDLNFGATDCSLPMSDARKNNEKFDAFAIYTDNETWHGGNPMDELGKYRKKSGIHDAKLVVVGITSTDFTIADPSDRYTLDVVGTDADTPAMISNFIAKS